MTADKKRPTLGTQAVFNASPVGVFTVDASGKVLTWNAPASRIFGWPAHEVIGAQFHVIPSEPVAEAELRSRVLAGATIEGLEVRAVRRDGAEIDVSLAAAPLRDSEDRVNGVVHIVMD